MSAIVDPVFDDWRFAPDPGSVFGPIVSAFEVEHALAACIRVWIRDYLAECERQRGLEPEGLPQFRSIVAAAQPEKWPEDQLPALLIASPGLADTTSRRGIEVHGDGGYVFRWRVDCVAEISARGNREAMRLARLYAATVRALVVQQTLRTSRLIDEALPSLRRIDLTGERYDLRDWTVDRTRCAGSVSFVVEVADVLTRGLGPREPFFPPTDPDVTPPEMVMPNVERARVDVTKTEVT
jgi:hypothetical protein